MLILNSKDSEGRTALHLMVAVDNRKLVRYLTSREDCLLSEQDHMQRTPLHLAAILGRFFFSMPIIVTYGYLKPVVDKFS